MKSFLLKGKKPIVKWGMLEHGTMFKGEVPVGYNLAICPTPGVIIVDIDIHGESNGFKAVPKDILKELKRSLHYTTANNGLHVWLKYTGKSVLANKASGLGVDLRTDKGYAVWYHDRPIEDCQDDILNSSKKVNKWLKKLFTYKNK